MPDVMRIVEQFSIITDQDKATATLRVLKEGDTFAVFDRHGDVIPAEACYLGWQESLALLKNVVEPDIPDGA